MDIINKFAAAVHHSYLCMKIPTTGGVLSIFGSQEEARSCKDNTSKTSKNVHVIEENQEEPSAKGSEASEGVKPAEHTKKVSL
jgi:hypothetical protein